ncbi:MAG: undecaprenyl-phosphate glucose phosphotransferase [Ardenticatenaceae bacterium]|nr:undecaprenyl-phosphate glucose phosphotransferase [Ardenticatenaceae bacterium]
MTNQKIRTTYTISLVILDAILISVAFILAYQLRLWIPWPEELANPIPIAGYTGLILVQVISIIAVLFFYRQYYIPRAVSRVDQFYYIFAAVSIGTLMAVAISTFIFKGDEVIRDYPRAMIIYAWVLTIVLLLIGRVFHQLARAGLRRRYGIGEDRLLVIGTGDMAQVVVQRILWSPQLGYKLIGIVNGDDKKELLGVPVLGKPEDLPTLIEQHAIDEVIIAMPEKGHRETVRVISYCERGRVSIKTFPDIFQFVTSEATIDDLGGLPLLTVRDFALRGYMLIFKRWIDFLVSAFGLIFLSPLMLLVALAIKLESPGPVFFVQERMGLDGKPFLMIKFRSMRSDAEKDGPGWTTDDDPRQTKLGKLIRRIEVDELPNLINVFIGEMSLVGPRPEQAHYVAQFRKIVPRYMDRHRDKGGMTGWAQINGLRGDTSINERTKFDLWYSENWSVLLDVKIILRTIWQIVDRKNGQRSPESTSAVAELKVAPPQDNGVAARQSEPSVPSSRITQSKS